MNQLKLNQKYEKIYSKITQSDETDCNYINHLSDAG